MKENRLLAQSIVAEKKYQDNNQYQRWRATVERFKSSPLITNGSEDDFFTTSVAFQIIDGLSITKEAKSAAMRAMFFEFGAE